MGMHHLLRRLPARAFVRRSPACAFFIISAHDTISIATLKSRLVAALPSPFKVVLDNDATTNAWTTWAEAIFVSWTTKTKGSFQGYRKRATTEE